MISKKEALYARITLFKYALKDCIKEISILENNINIDANSKLSKIKIIREEINKIANQIDKVKKEIILVNSYDVN
tara:strand:- start:42 stop:266 length:225 start_codon:yes stop_codon:yes gene_type:complete